MTGLSITSAGKWIFRAASRLEEAAADFMHQRDLNDYMKSDRRPWRRGYGIYRNNYLSRVLDDATILEAFRKSQPLPPGYGFRLDARVVEIPWVLARLRGQAGRLLDAGSSLNHHSILTSPILTSWKITILTLAPEPVCHWKLGVSYLFGDLRELDFRDDWFEAIACISTIEHVGMDNSRYAATGTGLEGRTTDFLEAIIQLRRVLKPGGSLYVTFPFGRYENHGWFQQFDAPLVDRLIEAFCPKHFSETVFRYDPDGWILSDRTACAQCQFFDVHTSKYFDPASSVAYPPDYPAGERAVACLELVK